MAFNAKGFKTISHMGTPDSAGSVGTNLAFHTYVTNDDAAAVETANYFDPLLTPVRVKKGDQISCSLDIDGTPALRHYVVSAISGGHVTVTASAATAIT